jgi:hypothetical protein
MLQISCNILQQSWTYATTAIKIKFGMDFAVISTYAIELFDKHVNGKSILVQLFSIPVYTQPVTRLD